MKALVRERILDWEVRLTKKLGKNVVELTGNFVFFLRTYLVVMAHFFGWMFDRWRDTGREGDPERWRDRHDAGEVGRYIT